VGHPWPTPCGRALRATGFAPGESVDCGHPWPQTPPAGDTGTALTYAAHGVSSYVYLLKEMKRLKEINILNPDDIFKKLLS